MTLRIMLLNMFKVRRLPKRRVIPIKTPHPAMNGREPAPDITEVALEVLHVDRVEADDRREQSDIRLGDGVAEEVRRSGELFGEVGFDPVEGAEEGCDGFFVGFLRGCEAGFVDAVVYVVVDPIVGFVDLCP